MAQDSRHEESAFVWPGVNKLALGAVRRWMAAAWRDFAAAYAVAGAGLALFVFATAALSLPMLLDRRDMDTISAAIVSFNALRGNPAQMLAWAATIVVLTAAGFATMFVGLAIALPLVGHMAWHAYRETIAPYGR